MAGEHLIGRQQQQRGGEVVYSLYKEEGVLYSL
jgi:hypothetical protein